MSIASTMKRALTRVGIGASLAFASACGGDEPVEDTAPPEDTQSEPEDTGPVLPDGMPDDPRPLTVTVSGAIEDTLVFDTPTCSHPTGSSNFRAFWRNGSGAHVFVLFAEILGDYTEPGTYNAEEHTARVKLQEEAGGSGYYFAADTAQGDTLTITVDHVDVDGAWGEFTVSGLHGDEGAITLSPAAIPIWCTEVD